ncbi:MAG: hypothetical protein N2V74_01195 [Candidatus Methanospirare jalkutatii]|nr:MAG: hypothetical protein N2V74_04665 [Candidatus Methanospirare jalkutatii]UYZ40341.1 MAG: hypothetical protein N2V74_01195 [Candidatus Methanospirare jalkutatii]
MSYESFKKEVERVLLERGEPMTWSEIKKFSGKLKQRAPYHVFVQKLQGEIGLVRFKPRGSQQTLWALRRWFEEGRFRDLLPERMRFVVLHSEGETAFVADEFRNLRRIFPVKSVVVQEEGAKEAKEAGKAEEAGEARGAREAKEGREGEEAWERGDAEREEGGNRDLRRWDVVEAEISSLFPEEDRRPESIRVRSLRFLRRVEEDSERLKILESVSESGEFLHTDAWRKHGKTLGMTRPRFRCFYFYDARCQFFCDQRVCLGHDIPSKISKEEALGDKVYFILETEEQKNEGESGLFLWSKDVEWCLKAVISVQDPKQRRLEV